MTRYDSSVLQDQISSTCIDLIFEDAFFGHFLLSINRELSSEGPTMWVRPSDDDKIVMGINPEFWSKQLKSGKFRMGGIKHEVLHVVFKHITRFLDSTGGTRRFRNLKLFNIAADIVVNQYIKREWLIEGAVTLDTFPDLNLQKEMDVGYYYDKLQEFYKDRTGQLPPIQMSMPGLETGEGGGEGAEEGEEEGEGEGAGEGEGKEEGEGAGEGEGKEEGEDAGEGEGPGTGAGDGGTPSESWDNLSGIMSQAPGSRGGYHGFWGEMNERSDAAREVLEEWVDRQIVNSVNRLDSTSTWGELPGSLVEYLKEFMKSRKPKIDWRRSLRLFTENSQHTYATNTMKMPSRRYKKIALFPDGAPVYEMKDGKAVKDRAGNFIPVWESKYPGLKIRQKTRILVGIDTSGSLDNEEDLPRIFNELYHLAKRQVEITVVEIDEWIQRIYSFPHPEAVPEVKGRGGTDFNELLKYANGEEIDRSGGMRGSSHQGIQVWKAGRWVEERRVKLHGMFDGIVYFTDGQAATPTERVKMPILWVVAGRYALKENDKMYQDLPGQKVIVEV